MILEEKNGVFFHATAPLAVKKRYNRFFKRLNPGFVWSEDESFGLYNYVIMTRILIKYHSFSCRDNM